MSPSTLTETPTTAIHMRELNRDLALEGHVAALARLLYAVTFTLDPDEPEDRRIHQMPRLERIARMAVALVNEANAREAQRQAEVTFDDAMNGCERAALILDETHSRRDLVEAAFLRLRQIIQNQKPISGAIAVWQHALQRSR